MCRKTREAEGWDRQIHKRILDSNTYKRLISRLSTPHSTFYEKRSWMKGDLLIIIIIRSSISIKNRTKKKKRGLVATIASIGSGF